MKITGTITDQCHLMSHVIPLSRVIIKYQCVPLLGPENAAQMLNFNVKTEQRILNRQHDGSREKVV